MKTIEIKKLPNNIINDLEKETRSPKCDYILENQGKLYRLCHLNPRGTFKYRVIYFSFKEVDKKWYLNYFATSTPLFLKDYAYLLILLLISTISVIIKYRDPLTILSNIIFFPIVIAVIPLITTFLSLLVNIFSSDENTVKIGKLLSKTLKN